ncbi:MAG: UDP-N-acetylglucosamine 2-epimerase (non-hydrolyzing) [Tannerellaceae bacterium]|jgi:UDP-GlcNAc3NAcA epimerase|nr:UDP-N-acetylglucosamine 2-epimerase (non-hydrolyzing) [Tannerellaceae bacterium]
MKIVTVVGARPQFVKAALVSRAILESNASGNPFIDEYILHTGQHYDANMSDVFFDDMKIPSPRWRIEPGKETAHGAMTGRMMGEIEKILLHAMPDKVIVYGDTNSTLAGALASAKLNIPVVHVEAGMRSFNRSMPEEVNRVLTDHMSSLLLSPTRAAVDNLFKEGIREGVYHVGDVMYDAALLFGRLASSSSLILRSLGVEERPFRLCTLHRAENTAGRERLSSILSAIMESAAPDLPYVFPLHPRTRLCMEEYGLMRQVERHPGIILTSPLGFLDMVALEMQAALILTDSGGVQKEAYFHHTPCITLREETEWIETVKAGWNQIAGWKKEDILRCLKTKQETFEIDDYGDGHAAKTISRILLSRPA